MSSNLVIAAIPDEDDRVWRISSEKIPHMTILFLGDSNKVANLEQIMQFVQHAAETSLKRFDLPVDRRGELGEDKADVLFFKQGYGDREIRDFRSTLLQDQNIKTAYDSSPQFEGGWKPHLTLGYPETPAKSIPEDHPKIYDVRFNKIAVWTGDFQGPDFLLKDYWDEMANLDIPMDVAMSNLEHHGVKGQKWGVRKVEGGGDKAHIRIHQKTGQAGISTASTVAIVAPALIMPPLIPLAFLSPRVRAEVKAARAVNKGIKADKKWNKELTTAQRAVEIHNTASDEINKKIPDFNNDKRWQNADGTKIRLPDNPAKMKEYNTAVERELLNPEYAKAAVKVHGTSPTGRYKFEIKDSATALLKLTDATKVEHASGDELSVQFKILRDADGHIIGFTSEEDDNTMTQTMNLGAEFISHHGVKGQKWGVRKENAASIGRAAKSAGGKVGKAALSVGRFAGDVGFEANLQNEQTRNSVNISIMSMGRKAFKRTDLPAINAKPEHVKASKRTNRLLHPLDPSTKAYRKEVKEAYIQRLEAAANSMTNTSGTRQYTIRERGWELPPEGGALPRSKNYWAVTSREIKHADGEFIETVEVIMDKDGFITDLKPVENALAQTMNLGAEFLSHYGIKGMHWGVRRQGAVTTQSHIDSGILRRQTRIQTKGGESHPAANDAVKAAVSKQKLKKSGVAALSNAELRELQTRIQLETQVKQLITSKGQKLVTKQLEEEGKQQLSRGVRKAALSSPGVAKTVRKGARKTAATVATTAVLL